jgi:dephospho-CoA kinase
MLKIGITGGIGSGKTTVAKLFQLQGVPIYNSDIRAKQLMAEDEALKKGLVLAFGEEVYTDRRLNRAWLATRVFNNEKELAILNGLVHPAVERDFTHWCLSKSDHPYILKEAALLYESQTYKNLDFVIVVAAPEEMRIERAILRDGLTKQEVMRRFENQLSEEQRLSRADYILTNDDSHSIIKQVIELHQHFITQGN